MAQAMHCALTQDKLHPAFNLLDQTLASHGNSVDPGDLQLHIANALWGQKGYPFVQGFLDLLAEYYGGGMNLVDFSANPDGCRQTINRWVSGATGNRINNLLPEGSILSVTRLVLTNAIYFKGCWADSFRRADTRDTAFSLLDGNTVTAPLMYQQNGFPYAEGTDFQAVELYYRGGQVSMVVLLPAAGRFTEFESRLGDSLFESICAALQSCNVTLSLPKFTFTSGTISLRQVLSDMGMPVAFTAQADFTGMATAGQLFIGDVLHQAFVAVDEHGTEAAAQPRW